MEGGRELLHFRERARVRSWQNKNVEAALL